MEVNHWLSRTELLIGKKNIDKLGKSHVLIAGLGGVGGHVAESICRAGVGAMTIIDNDKVMPTNLNRQLLAMHSTLGMDKTSILQKRLLDINPRLKLTVSKVYLKDEKIPEMLATKFDYVVDAIDTLSPKIYFIKNCLERNYRLISSMGAGGRLDPGAIKVDDISRSYGCTLAQVVRKKLHGMGIRTGFKVVFTPEKVDSKSIVITKDESNKKSIVGTISYMPAMFGLFAASVVIRDLIR